VPDGALALLHLKEYNGHEIVIQRPDGSRLTALAYANPIRDEAGRLLGAVNVRVEITDRKRAENALFDADRSKDEFLATLAHELRNPLAPLRHAVTVMRSRPPASGDAKWSIDLIERQMQPMTRLVDDLLDVSRITRNKIELLKAEVDMSEVLGGAVETSRPAIDAASRLGAGSLHCTRRHQRD
jgi:signal transduction histidine kinase